MRFISTNIDGIESLRTARSYIGKKVVSKSGSRLGTVKDVVFVKDNLRGIVVGDLFVDKEFFSNIGDALMLTIDPVTRLLQRVVFDADGRKMGKVKDISMKGNDLRSIIIKRGVFAKDLSVDFKDIAVMKDNIILKRSYE